MPTIYDPDGGFQNTLTDGEPEHKDFIAEIYYNGEFLALIHLDRGCDDPSVEIYPRKDGAPWSFDLRKFESALVQTRDRLVAFRPRDD